MEDKWCLKSTKTTNIFSDSSRYLQSWKLKLIETPLFMENVNFEFWKTEVICWTPFHYPPIRLTLSLSLPLFLVLGTESTLSFSCTTRGSQVSEHRKSISRKIHKIVHTPRRVPALTSNPFSYVFLFHFRVDLSDGLCKCWIQREILLIRKEKRNKNR